MPAALQAIDKSLIYRNPDKLQYSKRGYRTQYLDIGEDSSRFRSQSRLLHYRSALVSHQTDLHKVLAGEVSSANEKNQYYRIQQPILPYRTPSPQIPDTVPESEFVHVLRRRGRDLVATTTTIRSLNRT